MWFADLLAESYHRWELRNKLGVVAEVVVAVAAAGAVSETEVVVVFERRQVL